jgi:sulfite reductase beta subunit-like hemoprotein
LKNSSAAEFHELYLQLKIKIDEYLFGGITADQLKPFAAPFGIYEQRNGLFMVRIRVSGGHITLENLRDIAKIMERNKIGSAHLSTRQDIQLHDVSAENIFSTLESCDLSGFPFKGGGGNTYRNIIASADSGFGHDSIFDVLPYVDELNSFLKKYEKAFGLPRKLKAGFFSNQYEALNAAVQDLGFVAKIRNGRKGFKVYGGGGMGRGSSLGIELFNFLPDSQVIRCAVAMTDLFYDHGDRINRNQARIRFILKKFGADEFKKLFNEYYAKTPDYVLSLAPEFNYAHLAEKVKRAAARTVLENGYDSWRKHAVIPTNLGPDISSVRLYVPHGNLTAPQLVKLAALVEKLDIGFLRLLPSQDILIPLAHSSSLVEIYNLLLKDFSEIDLALKSFKGHIVSCVGSGICKIGILKSPDIADAAGAEMDKMLPADTPEKVKILRTLTDHVRISGCPNSCAGHPAAKIGLQGQKKRIGETTEDVCLFFTGLSTDENALRLSAPATEGEFVKVADVPLKINALSQSSPKQNPSPSSAD